MTDVLIGVVGAGLMGCAVAAELSRVGARVLLYDVSDTACRAAKGEIRNSLRMRMLLKGEPLLEPIETVLSRVAVSSRMSDLVPCEVLIENITEDMVAKEDLHRKLCAARVQATVLIVNSSTVEIARVAEWSARPDTVVGVHFMNPVALIDGVELILPDNTRAEAADLVYQLLATLGKKALTVRDTCGYVSNRIYMLTINEAIRTLSDAVASAETIDQIFQNCFGWKVGPLATADIIGLDTVLKSLEAMRERMGDERYLPSPALMELVAQGHFGRKSGKGIYEYA